MATDTQSGQFWRILALKVFMVYPTLEPLHYKNVTEGIHSKIIRYIPTVFRAIPINIPLHNIK